MSGVGAEIDPSKGRRWGEEGARAPKAAFCDRTIALFGRDFERFGALHEYCQPDSEELLNRGFQNWNHRVLNMTAWREGRAVVEEFRPE